MGQSSASAEREILDRKPFSCISLIFFTYSHAELWDAQHAKTTSAISYPLALAAFCDVTMVYGVVTDDSNGSVAPAAELPGMAELKALHAVTANVRRHGRLRTPPLTTCCFVYRRRPARCDGDMLGRAPLLDFWLERVACG